MVGQSLGFVGLPATLIGQRVEGGVKRPRCFALVVCSAHWCKCALPLGRTRLQVECTSPVVPLSRGGWAHASCCGSGRASVIVPCPLVGSQCALGRYAVFFQYKLFKVYRSAVVLQLRVIVQLKLLVAGSTGAPRKPCGVGGQRPAPLVGAWGPRAPLQVSHGLHKALVAVRCRARSRSAYRERGYQP